MVQDRRGVTSARPPDGLGPARRATAHGIATVLDRRGVVGTATITALAKPRLSKL
jgi:hypothetical protein